MGELVIMPKEDYVAACDAIREKTKTTNPIKSGEVAGLIQNMSGSGADEVVKGICEGTPFVLKGELVESVDDNVFSANQSVIGVDLPNATTIGSKAFSSCKSLLSVNLPNVNFMEPNAFVLCSALTEVNLDNLIDVPADAFRSCSRLERVNAPKLKTIGAKGFYSCVHLEEISFDLLKSVDDSAFDACGRLTTLHAPLLTAIGNAAFRGTPLASVHIPNIETIGEDAFYECSTLETFETKGIGWPRPTTLGARSFRGCALLCDEAVNNLVKELETIPEEAFYNCTSITKVDVPLATTIGDKAFSGCSNLAALILRPETEVSFLPSALYGTPMVEGTGNVYVPSSVYASYIATWSVYAQAMGVPGFEYVIIRKIEDYPEICG